MTEEQFNSDVMYDKMHSNDFVTLIHPALLSPDAVLYQLAD